MLIFGWNTQAQEALEKKYIEAIVDKHTRLITSSIPDVMAYLFKNHGKVRSKEVDAKNDKVMSMQRICV